MIRVKHRKRSVLFQVLLLLGGLFAWVFVPGPSGNPAAGLVLQMGLLRIAASPSSGTKAIDATARIHLKRAGPLVPVVEVVNVTLVEGSEPILTTDPRYPAVADVASSSFSEYCSLGREWFFPRGEWSTTASDVHDAIRTGVSVRLLPKSVVKLCGLMATIAATLWIVAIFISNRRYKHAIVRGLCLGCGYSIGTLALCPECGRARTALH